MPPFRFQKTVKPAKPAWYKIQEIPIKSFLELAAPLYDILEGKKLSKSQEDPFAKNSWIAYYEQDVEAYKAQHILSQKERAWTMAFGNLHQKLMGLFAGWEDYKTGHATGCDIGKIDGTCVAEIKNNTNTMNSSSQESVLQKLKKQKALGKRALLVIVNGGIRKKQTDGVEWISGKEFYAELSGRAEFMDDLQKTFDHMFKTYKTLAAVKASLEIV